MTMYSQYIYSLMLYTVRNQYLFSSNNSIHQYRTRYNNDLHLPIANLKKYKDGPYFMAIKIYDHLPEYIKALTSDLKSFKKNPKGVLVSALFVFYSRIVRYTGCNRRNGPDFRRVFLMLNYTEKPQNTYIQS